MILASAAGDVELHVEAHGPVGSAPPLVFSHGWADTADVWAAVVDALAPPHRAWTWDLRGHGRSTVVPPGRYSRDLTLADLRTVMQAAQHESGSPVVLVGHSLGGYLALAEAITEPHAVAGLVLVAAGPGFRSPTGMQKWNESVDRSARELGVPPGQEEISKHTDSFVFDHLDDITCPVAVILGERDRRFAASAEVFAAHLDVRATVVVPDAGHMVQVHQPAAVAAAIAGFCAGLG